MSNPPILGQRPETNNPLLILAGAMEKLEQPLKEIAHNTRPDATAVLPHRYGVTVAQTQDHGKVWGSFCLACSDSAAEFIFPCRLEPDEPIKPPQFFTIGQAWTTNMIGELVPDEASTTD
jgi:hypothetical protein